MSFESLGLEAELVRAVREQGYETPTPVQNQAIPAVLAGHDLLAGAQTGTGKTAAFALPVLQGLRASAGGRRQIRALVLTPTRELAAQVGESFNAYGRHLSLRTAVVFGGVGFNPQMKVLQRGVDVVVATPGRLLDHASQDTVDLSRVEVLVLDEADRMLDMGFLRDIRRILALLPERRQNLLFSATYAKEIRELARQLLHEPVQVQVAPRNATADRVNQIVFPLDKGRKREFLSHMIGQRNWRQVLVFTRTKHGANRLAQQLERDGLSAAAIHGNKSQGARTRALQGFKEGSVRVLVATDIAARGLDIDQLPHVVNYELPNVPEDYVHRIGRTGRAGREGQAVSLVCAEEGEYLAGIERLIKREIPREVVLGYEPQAPLARIAGKPGRPGARRGKPSPSRRRRNRSRAAAR
jgi:ATP-dependent RNA helicase RhlE